MSLGPAVQYGILSGLDAVAGMTVGTVVETFAPPIAEQSALQLALEGMVQLITITYLAREASAVIHRGGDAEETPAFYIGVITGMPNTMAKLTMAGGYAKGWIKSILFPQDILPAPQPVSVPTTTQTTQK